MARDATPDAIKKAYRALARKHHPDVNPGDKASEARFKEVQHAYDILSDKEKRVRYDQFGSAAFEGMAAAGQQPGGAEWTGSISVGRDLRTSTFPTCSVRSVLNLPVANPAVQASSKT